MSANKTILKTLNIEPKELLPVVLLVMYSFFMGASVAFFYTASTSIFLVNFERTMLPVAYAASGVLVYFLSRVFSLIQRQLTLSKLLIVAISFLLLSVGTLSISYYITKNVWVCFMLFIWIRAFVFVNGITFWVTASKVFNLQQAKRLFGFIGAGDVVAAIISYISIPFLLRWMVVDELYYIAMMTLLACTTVLFVISSKFSKELSVAVVSTPKHTEVDAVDVGHNEVSFAKNKYHLWIFIMAMMGVFGLYFVEFMFFVQSRIEYPDKNLLAGFLGLFFGLCAIIEFIFKTAVYRRLLNRFGIKLGLIILPILLSFSYALAFGYGIFYGAGGLFFSFVVLSRFFISSVRKSISDPSFQLLFQIIPSAKRVALQSKVEGIPKALGSIVSGILLFVVLKYSTIGMVYLSLFALLFALLWIQLSILTYGEYRRELRSSLVKMPVLVCDYTTTQAVIGFFKQHLINTNIRSFPNVFAAFMQIEPALVEPVLVEVLAQAPVGVKKQILDILQESRFVNLKDDLVQRIANECDVDLERRMLTWGYTDNRTRGIEFDTMVTLCRSTDYRSRVTAARFFGKSRRQNSHTYIVVLLQDLHPEVRKAAMLAAGRNQRPETWPYLFDGLGDIKYQNVAVSALISIGEPVLKELELFFQKLIDQAEVSLLVLKIIRRIGGDQAIGFLRSRMNHTNKLVRNEVLTSLNKFEYKATQSEYSIIKNSIEEEVRFMVWNVAARMDLQSSHCEILITALEGEYVRQKIGLFDLLSVIYDNKRINLIKEHVTRTRSETRALALEIIDMTLSEELKSLIVPLLGTATGRELLSMYARTYPQQELSVEDRCLDIIQKDFAKVSPWIKANAMFRLESFSKVDTKMVLESLVCHPNLMISQTALLGVYNRSTDWYEELIQKYKLDNLLIAISDGANLPVYEKVSTLSKVALFASMNQGDLLNLAVGVKLVFLQKNELLKFDMKENWCTVMYVIASGVLAVNSIDGMITLGQYGFIPCMHQDNQISYKATEAVVLYELNGDLLYGIFADNLELAALYIEQLKRL